jgi:hypothetical protein
LRPEAESAISRDRLIVRAVVSAGRPCH